MWPAGIPKQAKVCLLCVGNEGLGRGGKKSQERSMRLEQKKKKVGGASMHLKTVGRRKEGKRRHDAFAATEKSLSEDIKQRVEI